VNHAWRVNPLAAKSMLFGVFLLELAARSFLVREYIPGKKKFNVE
jgi:hypothetical protein